MSCNCPKMNTAGFCPDHNPFMGQDALLFGKAVPTAAAVSPFPAGYGAGFVAGLERGRQEMRALSPCGKHTMAEWVVKPVWGAVRHATGEGGSVEGRQIAGYCRTCRELERARAETLAAAIKWLDNYAEGYLTTNHPMRTIFEEMRQQLRSLPPSSAALDKLLVEARLDEIMTLFS